LVGIGALYKKLGLIIISKRTFRNY